MSYDLHFANKDDRPAMTAEGFTTYFSSRPRYELNGSQAWYSNNDTGVYFSFEFEPRTAPPEDWAEFAEEGDEWLPSAALFNINYNRPSFFAREAASEVAAFVEHFDLIVDDPQVDGMGRGLFESDKFVEGWSKGNRWAISAVRQEASVGAPLTCPGDRLTQIWRWNVRRQERQAQVGDGVFVPKISFATREGALHSFAVWTDAIPILLPQVDLVVIVRVELARRRWFGWKQPETLVAPWNEIAPSLTGFRRVAEPIPHLELTYAEPPAAVVQLVKRSWARATKDGLVGIGADSVIDSELFSG